MNSCAKFREQLVLHLEGALGEAESRAVSGHLAVCEACRDERKALAKVRGWLTDPELFSPAEDLAWQSLPQRMAERAVSFRPARRWMPSNFGSLGWAFSLAVSVVLCLGLVWWAHRTVPEQPAEATAPAPGNEAFLGRLQTAYAREATSRYLIECQDLLIQVMRAEKNCDGEKYDVSFEVAQARELLRRKRMLDAELQSPAVAHAKSLCDELEGLLVNLSTSDRCESPDRVHRMERFIEREKLLLRINVLQSELS